MFRSLKMSRYDSRYGDPSSFRERKRYVLGGEILVILSGVVECEFLLT